MTDFTAIIIIIIIIIINRHITAEDHEDSSFFDTVYVGFVSC